MLSFIREALCIFQQSFRAIRIREYVDAMGFTLIYNLNMCRKC